MHNDLSIKKLKINIPKPLSWRTSKVVRQGCKQPALNDDRRWQAELARQACEPSAHDLPRHHTALSPHLTEKQSQSSSLLLTRSLANGLFLKCWPRQGRLQNQSTEYQVLPVTQVTLHLQKQTGAGDRRRLGKSMPSVGFMMLVFTDILMIITANITHDFLFKRLNWHLVGFIAYYLEYKKFVHKSQISPKHTGVSTENNLLHCLYRLRQTRMWYLGFKDKKVFMFYRHLHLCLVILHPKLQNMLRNDTKFHLLALVYMKASLS